VQSLLHSRQTHFKTGSTLFFPCLLALLALGILDLQIYWYQWLTAQTMFLSLIRPSTIERAAVLSTNSSDSFTDWEGHHRFFLELQSRFTRSPKTIAPSDGSGSKVVWVWVWKISPKNPKFFNFFSHQVKKISSGWVKKYLGQSKLAIYYKVC